MLDSPVEVGAEAAFVPLASTPPSQPDMQPTPKWRRRQRRNVPTCPDPGSLYDILRENCGTSLFVLPILWTDHHPRLLRAEFMAEEPTLTPTPSSTMSDLPDSPASGSSSQRQRPSEIAEALSYDLTSLLSPEDTRPFSKSRAIKSVLSTLFQSAFSRPNSGAELDMHFGDRMFRSAVRVPVLWKSADAADSSFDSAVTRPVSSFGHAPNGARESNDFSCIASTQSSQGASQGPIVAYVNRTHLSMIRRNLFRIVDGPEDGDRANMPVTRLQALRSKQLVPSEPDRDAYLLGVFLAMAQAHFYEPSPSRMASQMFSWNAKNRADRISRPSEFHDVKLRIITHDDETSDFMVYTTVVTAAFLRRFAEPKKAHPNTEEQAGMHIEYTRVPVWPILGLRERLGKALGRDLVGDVQQTMDLFSHDEADVEDAKDGDTNGHTDTNGHATANGNGDADTTTEADKATARYKEAQAVAEQQQKQEKLGSLKRKRTADKVSLTDMLTASLDDNGNHAANGSDDVNIHNGSGAIVAPSPAAAAAVAITSPTLSPRAKRRQTRRSLSSSSLAVF
ncbi:uncharacterized protein SPSK_09010 [Sporothrix schenckii 1099-18]|uniref:Uncharacterized protein n=1 Tax=Sporothrix schenckii 1099-18 TaxID=1397361 RepID=A0A0F2M5U5_SPOSC|nr:uncharacterized protein SPSK_09010 [Sporothrix schenckii 1099-18]KJR84459.1 hypothetical protein SPSK_09010 [Sporothrix schenckii 1099-18]